MDAMDGAVIAYRLDTIQAAVLHRVSARAGDKERGCYESQPNMAMGLSISDRTLRRTLAHLEGLNAILRLTGKQVKGTIAYIPNLDMPLPMPDLPVCLDCRKEYRTAKALRIHQGRSTCMTNPDIQKSGADSVKSYHPGLSEVLQRDLNQHRVGDDDESNP